MGQLEFELEQIPLAASDGFPNNERCPLLVYRGAFGSRVSPGTIEDRFAEHGWSNGWRAGVYAVHHYHSTAHEVLGCFAGSAEIQVGGPSGTSLKLGVGDVLVIPAGVSHKRLTASSDFCVVGAYAGGRNYDMNYGREAETRDVLANITAVPLPSADPVVGESGPLLRYWRS